MTRHPLFSKFRGSITMAELAPANNDNNFHDDDYDDDYDNDCNYYGNNCFWKLIDQNKIVKLLEQDMAHGVPVEYQRNDTKTNKVIDFSTNNIIVDNYSFGFGVNPGGFSVTRIEFEYMLRWLVIGSGHDCKDKRLCIRKRHCNGDGMEHWQQEAARLRVMDVMRVCTKPDVTNINVMEVQSMTSNTGTFWTSHLQFQPKVIRLNDFLCSQPTHVKNLLEQAMTDNPRTILFVAKYFPQYLDSDTARQCVVRLPFVAYRLPKDFVGPELFAQINRKDMLPPWCLGDFDNVIATFVGPNSPPTVPTMWVKTMFGEDKANILANQMMDDDPMTLFKLPVQYQTAKRVAKWLHRVHQITARLRKLSQKLTLCTNKAQYDNKYDDILSLERRIDADNQRLGWIPSADNLKAQQFEAIVVSLRCIPRFTSTLYEDVVPDHWWSPSLATALAPLLGTLKIIPKHIVTTEMAKAYLIHGGYYKFVPCHLRSPELDEISVLSAVHQNYSGGKIDDNYKVARTRTLEMSRALCESHRYDPPDFSLIPVEHFGDKILLEKLCSNIISISTLYNAIPTQFHDMLDALIVKERGNLLQVPANRVTDAFSRQIPISNFNIMTKTVQQERLAEHERHKQKLNSERSDYHYRMDYYGDFDDYDHEATQIIAREIGDIEQ